jgi:anthraniloyl-CoA monooxygenase
MRIVCLGGGPAGLYFSILMKKANPASEITVIERNQPDSTFGWGIVFSDKTMDGFRHDDPGVVAEIERNFHHWDDVDVFFKNRRIVSGGHGFCGIGRLKLLQIFQARALELGVKLQFATEFKDPDDYAKEYDLVIGSDGVNSTTRRKHESHFNPRIDVRKCRFIWLGTKKKLNAFTFAFKETPWGWFNLHAYQFNEEWATFIVETPEETWLKAGIDKMEPDQSIAFCEKLFADMLDGNRLISNATHLRGSAVWLKFNRVLCERWFKDNIVLLGDAAHTAHFTIGSGTKLAMEDARELVKVLNSTEGDVPTRLARYQAEREIEALKLQSAARNRMTWFEDVERYVGMEPEQFAFAVLTSSQRVGHANQKLRDQGYTDDFDRWFAAKCGLPLSPGADPVPPMFTPYKLRGMTLANRVVVSPMCTYSAEDGLPTDFHLVHYGSRGLGGGRPDRDRDDLRCRRCAHHPGLCRHLERRPAAGLEAHRRIHPSQRQRQGVAADRPRRAQRRHPPGLGCDRHAAAGGRLAAAGAVAAALYSRHLAGAEGNDPGRHGPGQGRVPHRHTPSRRGWVRHGRIPCRTRLPDVVFHFAADQPARRRIRRQPGKTLPLSSGSFPRHARAVARGQADVGADLGA